MRSQFLRSWLGYCGLALSFAACSSSSDSGSDASGGAGDGGSAGQRSTTTMAGTKGQSQPVAGTGTTNGDAGAAPALGSGGEAGAAAQVVGKTGGIVMQNGVTLAVPEGALPQDTPITVTAIDAPKGFAPVSETFQFGPDGTQFAHPVMVTIPFKSPTPGAHVFWSNASGGFDDIGGTVTGSNVTASVTHFSIGFAAVPMNVEGMGGADAGGASTGGTGGSSVTAGSSGTGGSGGTSETGGASGSSGAASAGNGGMSGASGTGGAGGTSGGIGGAGGTSGGIGGAGGTSGGGSGGTGGAGGTSGGTGGAGGGNSLCTTWALNLPGIKVTNTAGLPPDPSTYTGGTLATGYFYEFGVAHYGNGVYAGPTQAEYKIDTTAMTIQIGERMNAQAYYVGMTYTQTDSHTLHVTVACDTSGVYPTSFDYDYTFANQTLVLTVRGSADVLTL